VGTVDFHRSPLRLVRGRDSLRGLAAVGRGAARGMVSDLGAHPAAQESHEGKPDLREPSLSCIHAIRWRVNFDK
jgi:hypothetical protein